jgi:hypothetical protein
VADLGQVWNVVARPGSACRTDAAPVRMLGPATLPPLRPALTQVVFVVPLSQVVDGVGPALPASPESSHDIDARPVGSAELSVLLRKCADRERSRVVRVLVDESHVDHHLAELRAHPTRPFAVTDVHHCELTATVPRMTDGCVQQLPALLAWIAALDGSTSRTLRVRLRMPDRHALWIDLIRGIVTRCELREATMPSMSS